MEGLEELLPALEDIEMLAEPQPASSALTAHATAT